MFNDVASTARKELSEMWRSDPKSFKLDDEPMPHAYQVLIAAKQYDLPEGVKIRAVYELIRNPAFGSDNKLERIRTAAWIVKQTRIRLRNDTRRGPHLCILEIYLLE